MENKINTRNYIDCKGTSHQETVTTLTDIEKIYNDIKNKHSFFTTIINDMENNNIFITGETVYNRIEIFNDRLEFHASDPNGSELYIIGNIEKAEKISSPEYSFDKYHFYIERRKNPFVLLAIKE